MQLADTTVKQATGSKEMELVYSIRTKVFIEEQQVPKDLEMDEWEEKSVHFLAWLEDIPVGTCRLRFIDHDTGKAERVAVLKEYRKTGAGTKLMEALETFARQKGPKKSCCMRKSPRCPFTRSWVMSLLAPRLKMPGSYTCGWKKFSKDKGDVFSSPL